MVRRSETGVTTITALLRRTQLLYLRFSGIYETVLHENS